MDVDDKVAVAVIVVTLSMGLVIVEATLAAVLTAVEVGLMPRSPPLTSMPEAVADEPTNGSEVGRASVAAATLRLDADNEALTQKASLQPNENDMVTVFVILVVAVFAVVSTAVEVEPLPRPPRLTPMLKAVEDESSRGVSSSESIDPCGDTKARCRQRSTDTNSILTAKWKRCGDSIWNARCRCGCCGVDDCSGRTAEASHTTHTT